MDYTWVIRGLYVGYTWVIRGLYVGYTWVIHGLYMGYTWVIHGLYSHVVKNLKRNEPGHRGESAKQDLTSAEDITIELSEGCEYRLLSAQFWPIPIVLKTTDTCCYRYRYLTSSLLLTLSAINYLPEICNLLNAILTNIYSSQ